MKTPAYVVLAVAAGAWSPVGLAAETAAVVPPPAVVAPIPVSTPVPVAAPVAPESEELARLYEEDQADRKPAAGREIDWALVGPRDQAREKRAKELYTGGLLKTGRDFYHAAMILQHADQPEDYLLCHELCVVAIGKGSRSEKASWLPAARWLAAASEDRFLLSIGRAQRFGTQYVAENLSAAWKLEKMEAGVTDELRKAYGVPSLAEAHAKEVSTAAKTPAPTAEHSP